MALTPSTMVPLGTPAPAFSLPATDGQTVSLDTTNGGAVTDGADITFFDTLDAFAAGLQGLTLDAGDLGNIGFVELQRGNVDEAIKALERATAFNFRYVQAFANLANAHLMKGRLEESIENNLKAIKLQSNFAPAHNNLAIAYLEKGDYHRAAEHCDKAVELGYEVAADILSEIERHRKPDAG